MDLNLVIDIKGNQLIAVVSRSRARLESLLPAGWAVARIRRLLPDCPELFISMKPGLELANSN